MFRSPLVQLKSGLPVLAAPACVMFTVMVLPPPVRVKVPVRELELLLLRQATATEPLFVPDPGFRLIQLSDSVMFQLVLLLILKFSEPPEAPKFRLVGETARLGLTLPLSTTNFGVTQ